MFVRNAMAILCSAKDISKSFSGRALFSDLTFVVEEGERIGLIGPNGAGKSTLLRLLAGVATADSGGFSFRRGVRVGFLEQAPSLPQGETVEQAVLETMLPDGSGAALAAELISRLELSEFAKAKVETLSGGWQKRVALARELMKEPELLLLDEPTNHLDIESILWLEGFLAQAKFATVVVTHDRLFLQRVSNRILELDKRNPKGLLSVAGDYAMYLERKEALLAQQQTLEIKLRNTLRRETEWLRRGPKARTTKQSARIQAAHALQDQVSELEQRNQSATIGLEFESRKKQPKRLIEARKLTKSLSGKLLFKDLDLFLGPAMRVGLLGRNGCGKSTLIRTLLGVEEPDAGQLLRSEHLKVAYFEQNREALDPQRSLRKTLCPSGDQVIYRGRPVHILGYLDRFLFQKEQIDLPISRLSGGEQSRVLLAQLMLKEANVLVLDEPTNDLDVETLNVLEECLTQFEGAVLLVTHDRFFLDQVATTILAFPEGTDSSGKLIAFADLAQWENWREARSKNQKPKPPSPTTQSVPPEKKRKLSYHETREHSQMEMKIEEAEGRLAKFETEAAQPENQSNAAKLRELYESISNAQVEVERLYARWAELDALAGRS